MSNTALRLPTDVAATPNALETLSNIREEAAIRLAANDIVKVARPRILARRAARWERRSAR